MCICEIHFPSSFQMFQDLAAQLELSNFAVKSVQHYSTTATWRTLTAKWLPISLVSCFCSCRRLNWQAYTSKVTCTSSTWKATPRTAICL